MRKIQKHDAVRVMMDKFPFTLRFDDFHRFITSFMLLTFLICSTVVFLTIAFKATLKTWQFYLLGSMYFAGAVVSVVVFAWAINRWKKKQDIIDAIEKQQLEKLKQELKQTKPKQRRR